MALVKSIAGLLTGVLVAVVLFVALASPFPMAATSGNASQSETLSGNLTGYYQSVSSALTEAADKIEDEDLAQFYQKLVDGYELGEGSSWLAPDDGSDDPEAVPDIEKISRHAILLPLLEVADQIQDEDIAEFYQDFLEKVGWIESD